MKVDTKRTAWCPHQLNPRPNRHRHRHRHCNRHCNCHRHRHRNRSPWGARGRQDVGREGPTIHTSLTNLPFIPEKPYTTKATIWGGGGAPPFLFSEFRPLAITRMSRHTSNKKTKNQTNIFAGAARQANYNPIGVACHERANEKNTMIEVAGHSTGVVNGHQMLKTAQKVDPPRRSLRHMYHTCDY